MEMTNEMVAARIYVALELSKSKWVVAIHLPEGGPTSLYQVPGGDLDGLMTLLGRARSIAEQRGLGELEICSCYEAGYDGFWLHRALEARGVHNTVLDSASIKVGRRRKHVKTDRMRWLVHRQTHGLTLARHRRWRRICIHKQALNLTELA